MVLALSSNLAQNSSNSVIAHHVENNLACVHKS